MIFREATIEDVLEGQKLSINTRDARDVEQLDYVWVLEEGDVLGVGGFRMIVPSCAWCWVDLTDIGVEKIRHTYRHIRERIENFAREKGITRLQAFVRNSNKEIRLVEHLGFQQESVMERFYGDDDALMFVRIF